MAPISLASVNGGESFQAKVNALDRSDAPLDQRLREAGAILRSCQAISYQSDRRSELGEEAPVPLAIVKGLFRWLVKHLSTVTSNTKEPDLQPDYWNLFGLLISQMPVNAIANSLRNVKFLQSVNNALNLIRVSDPGEASPDQRQSSSDTLIGTETPSEAAAIESKSLKRKRSSAAVQSHDNSKKQKQSEWQDEYVDANAAPFFLICNVLKQFMVKIQGSPNSLTNCDEEQLKEAISTDTQVTAWLLSKALGYVRIFKQGDMYDVSRNRSQADGLLEPFLFLWNCLETTGEDSESQHAKLFCETCLSEALAVMCTEKLEERITTVAKTLENLVLHNAVNPVRKIFFSTGNLEASLQDFSIFDDHLSGILGAYELVVNITSEISTTPQPETVVFDLALRNIPDTAALRASADDRWLTVLLQYLCGIRSVGSLEKTLDSSRWRPSAARELLELSRQRGIKLDRSALEAIIRRALTNETGAPPTVLEWEIIGLCTALDPPVILLQNRSGENPLTRLVLQIVRMSPHLYKYPADDSLEHKIERLSVVHFILPLLRSHVQARHLDAFVLKWHEQLAVTRAHLLKAPGGTVDSEGFAKSVWEDSELLAAVSSAVTTVPHQLAPLLNMLAKELDSPDDTPIDDLSRLHSTCRVLSTILGGINSDRMTSELVTQAKEIRDRLRKLILDNDSMLPHSNLLWDTQSRLCERWPELFQEGESSVDGQDLLKSARKTFTQAVGFESHSLWQNTTSFSAFAFLWRVCNTSAGAGQLEWVERSAKMSTVTKLVCSVLDSTQERECSETEIKKRLLSADKYATLIMEQPAPLASIKPKPRQKLLVSVFGFALTRLTGMGPGSQKGETESEEVKLKSWLNGETLRNNSELHQDARATLLGQVDRITGYLRGNKMQDHIPKEESLMHVKSLLQALRYQDPAEWTKHQRGGVVEKMLSLVAEMDDVVDNAVRRDALSALAHFLRQPLRTNDPSQEQLRVVLKAKISVEPEKTSFEGAVVDQGIVPGTEREIQALLGEHSQNAEDPKSPFDPNRLTNLNSCEASQILRDFMVRLDQAAAEEKEKIVHRALEACRLDVSLPTLIFARKVCGAPYGKQDQTDSLKTGIQELLSQLFSIAIESKNMKRVLLAVRAIAAAFTKNGWAVNQLHVDLALTCASTVPAQRGPRAANEAPSIVTKEAPKGRSRLDLASARRLVFGSLAVRNPKNKDDEVKLRRQLDGRRIADAAASAPSSTSAADIGPAAIHPEESLDFHVPGALYSALCALFSATLLHHRARAGGRWHLVIDALRVLLGSLFEPYVKPTAAFNPDSALITQHRPWIHGVYLDQTHAASYARLLTLLCDPTPAAAAPFASKKHAGADARADGTGGRGGRSAPLHDTVKRAREVAGQHVGPAVLKELCAQRLKGQLGGADANANAASASGTADARAALLPGIWAVLDALGREGTAVVNEALTKPEREVFRGVWEEYVRLGKWKGG